MSNGSLRLQVVFGAIDKLTAPLRQMTGGSRALGKEMADTQKKLAGLRREQAQVAGYKGAEEQYRKTAAALDAAKQKTEGLRAQIAAVESPTKRMTNALASAERQETAAAARHDDQGRRLESLAGQLGAAGVAVDGLGEHENSLAERIRAANAELGDQHAAAEKSERHAEKMGKLRTAGAKLGAIGGTMGAGALYLANEARGFSSAMADIRVTSGLSADEIERMGTSINAMAPEVAQLQDSLAGGLNTLIANGLDANTSIKMLRAIGRTATAENADVVDLANASYAAFNNLKVPIGDAERALDAMTLAGKRGGVEMKDMAGAFPSLFAAAGSLGQKGVGAVADLSAALEVAKDGAGDAAEAANNVQNLLNKINANSTIGNFKKLGIDLPAAMKKAYRDGKTPIEAIVELTKKATGGDMANLGQLFDDAQVQAALRPLVDGLDKYRSIRADASKANGTVNGDFNVRMGSDGEAQTRKYEAQMARVKLVAGTKLLPIVASVFEKIGGLIDRVSVWGERNPRLAQSLAVLFSVIAAVASVLGALAIAITFVGKPAMMVVGWLGKLGPVFRFLATGARMFGGVLGWIVRGLGWVVTAVAGFVGLPVGIVVAIGLAIAAAGYLIYRYWDQIKAAFQAGLAWFSGLVGQLADVGGRLMGGLWRGIKSAFATGIGWFLTLNATMLNIGVHLVQGLINGVGSMFGALKNKIVALGKSAVGWFKGVLGIHSPSRVFAQLGGHMMGGLALGLHRAEHQPMKRVHAAGVGLTRAMAGSLLVTAPAAARAGPIAAPALAASGPITIHIHAQPGQDADAIAAAVRREIAAQQRDQARAGRASYKDAD